ncbi:hypothetical protein [Flammeovirga pacifica]|uniref:Uncharacterized protein n=1 Tax=Flammeovirga pacifica TaxID=915059 RepID=A0A1S1YSJ8_FLAPC|nr:hypothetical protein [Flammeovirga pacifica]OHX63976.1 hypothetical protein NH26_20410 [Flammeovirga pacifica]
MPNSIPYDHPSLVLGNIVDTKVLGVLKKIDSAQCTIDSAQQKMNSLIGMKKSVAMTINEVMDMKIDVTSLQSNIKEIDKSIANAANTYIEARLKNESVIQSLKDDLASLDLSETVESPIDFEKSQFIQKPLFSDSLKLDAQYFSFEMNAEDDTIANIETFIKESTSELGGKKSNEIASKASSQIAQQKQHHSIAGTLIISASCTHKNVTMIEPCIFDPDKALDMWNHHFDDKYIDTTKPSILQQSLFDKSINQQGFISIISGAVYGSSFVGMVHILNTENTSKAPSEELISSLNEKMRLGGWIENNSGGLGINESILDEVKKLLSTQQVSSHVTMITMGALPSIGSNQLSLGVNKLMKAENDTISKLISEGNAISTVDSSAEQSIEGKRNEVIQNAKVQSLIQGLQKVDSATNKVMDINSLMSAFENYLTTIKSSDELVGIPIQFYLKKINRKQVVKLWLDKYYNSQLIKKKNITSNNNE